jgi:hypothetical protein
MPTTQMDFHLTLDRCAGLTLDATCAARTAGDLPLPPSHRRQLTSITRHLEAAQNELFSLKEYPWAPPKPPKRQLELSL